MGNNRREFLKKGVLLGLAGLTANVAGKENLERFERAIETLPGEPQFTLPALPYPYDALEPYIDKQTMEIHHTKHHKAYIDKLNTALAEVDMKADDATKCKNVNEKTSLLVRNNLGGYYNHMLFWQMLKPNKNGSENKPAGALAEAINKNFKTFDDFKKEFSDKAVKIFGSGWCWLILTDKNELKITTTPNQDNPLMAVVQEKGKPIMALDVWEHAYYLKYQNKRADYITGWWNIANWEKASELFAAK